MTIILDFFIHVSKGLDFEGSGLDANVKDDRKHKLFWRVGCAYN